jgi:hypothetical protein
VSYRVIVRCVPYRQFSHVWFFLSQRRLLQFITLPTTFYSTWPVVSIYGVVGNAVVKLLSLLFVSELEERRESGLTGNSLLHLHLRTGAKIDGGLGHPTARPRCCSYIRRSSLQPKPQQQQQPSSYCRPQNTLCDGQDPLAVALPRAQGGRTEETQNRAPNFHHVSY